MHFLFIVWIVSILSVTKIFQQCVLWDISDYESTLYMVTLLCGIICLFMLLY